MQSHKLKLEPSITNANMSQLLSKIMNPTSGSMKINGRVSALIEVTAGFHPDLTGRENVFLNGAIMGMTKMDIKRKLDEIIETKDRVNQAKKMNEVMTDIMSAFQRMTAIVSMQENKIERIDQETRTAETNIKKGRKEVEQIYDSVASKRSLIIKVFATILVFSIIYILFLM